MPATSVWDDPALKPESSQYMKFSQPGDKVEGTINAIGKHTFSDGKTSPKITFVEDDAPILTATQTILARSLFEVRPEPGEHLSVTFTRKEARPGGRELYHFFIEVTGKDGTKRTTGDAAPF